MKYTQEELINFPVGKLIDIIMQLQVENDTVTTLRRKLERVARIVNEEIVVKGEDSNENGNGEVKTTKRGRPRMTPEERAKSYEEYKRKKREAYAASKTGQQ